MRRPRMKASPRRMPAPGSPSCSRHHPRSASSDRKKLSRVQSPVQARSSSGPDRVTQTMSPAASEGPSGPTGNRSGAPVW